MRFDFGTDEGKAQEACHKLDVWKQAFRLDKKLLYKIDRGATEDGAAEPEAPQKKEENPKVKGKAKLAKDPSEKGSKNSGAPVHLLVRLYFSSHERLSEQRWIDRLPTEDLFKEAKPEVISKSSPSFEAVDKDFERLT